MSNNLVNKIVRFISVDRHTNSFQSSLIEEYRSDRPLRTLIYLYRRDWHYIALSMFFYVIKHSPEWIRPIIVANIIDIIAKPSQHQLSELWFNGIFLAVSIVQNIPTHYLHIRYMSLATRGMEANLRATLAQRLHELAIDFYKKYNTGALQNKILRDVESIETLSNQLFQYLPSTILTVGIAIAVTAVKVPWFLLFFVATVPIAVILMNALRKPLRDRNHVLRKQMEGMSVYLIEAIKLIPITRAHGVEATEMERTEGKLSDVRHAAIRVDSINAITGAASWVTLRTFSCICLVISAWCAYTGKLGIGAGDVVLLTSYFDSLTMSVVMILTVLPQMSKGFEAIRSVGEILECPDLEENQGKIIVKKIAGEFVFDRVSFIYPHHDRMAITDFSLHVAPGETIAIVGRSGAGKSTLLNLIIGFLRSTQGNIFIDGQDFNHLDLRTYRSFLSVVSQETILFEGTVRENILYGKEKVSDRELQQALEDANAFEFVSELPQGIDTLIGENGTKLSGGQRQRLAIARALIRNPRVLILDEATASLDTASEALIQQALERLMLSRTTFVVAHRLSTIRKADRIVVLEKGRIVEIGTHKQLLENDGIFAEFYSLQT